MSKTFWNKYGFTLVKQPFVKAMESRFEQSIPSEFIQAKAPCINCAEQIVMANNSRSLRPSRKEILNLLNPEIKDERTIFCVDRVCEYCHASQTRILSAHSPTHALAFGLVPNPDVPGGMAYDHTQGKPLSERDRIVHWRFEGSVWTPNQNQDHYLKLRSQCLDLLAQIPTQDVCAKGFSSLFHFLFSAEHNELFLDRCSSRHQTINDSLATHSRCCDQIYGTSDSSDDLILRSIRARVIYFCGTTTVINSSEATFIIESLSK